MKLLQAGPSPFARKCRVTLIETGADGVEVVDVATSPVETDRAVAAANPLGKIPVLVREDGPALHDSRVICRFLDDRGGGGLYPEARLWEVLTLEATADGIMDAAVILTYQSRYGEGAHWLDGQWDKVARALDALEGRWTPNLAGPLHMGQIAVGCALGYLDLRHDARSWRDGRPALADWEARFRERDSMRATVPA